MTISNEKRKSILSLYNECGESFSSIAKKLRVDRGTVRGVITGNRKSQKRASAIDIDEELLRETFLRCNKWAERTHEELQGMGIKIGYSTLTRRIRELGFRNREKKRAEKHPDIPGEEFQHDTSPYIVSLDGMRTKVQCSQIYYRYCKRRYVKFYPSFTRFHMRCFFYEAMNHFGYVPSTCIIDNTNLAVLPGTSGRDAIFVPEMAALAKMFGFTWMAHEIKHSDRKAGVERAFWTIETNFFPGREFISLEDLNKQARDWTSKHDCTPNKKTKLVPLDQFEHERHEMIQVSRHLPRPYRQHRRVVDQYGYIVFDSNNYWVERGPEKDVTVLEYTDSIQIYRQRKLIIEYPLPSFGRRDMRIAPKGIKKANLFRSRVTPLNSKEEKLRSMGDLVSKYLDNVLKITSPVRRNRTIRMISRLMDQLSESFFLKTIERATHYEIYNIKRLERIARHILKEEKVDSITLGEINLEDDLESYYEE